VRGGERNQSLQREGETRNGHGLAPNDAFSGALTKRGIGSQGPAAESAVSWGGYREREYDSTPEAVVNGDLRKPCAMARWDSIAKPPGTASPPTGRMYCFSQFGGVHPGEGTGRECNLEQKWAGLSEHSIFVVVGAGSRGAVSIIASRRIRLPGWPDEAMRNGPPEVSSIGPWPDCARARDANSIRETDWMLYRRSGKAGLGLAGSNGETRCQLARGRKMLVRGILFT